MGINPAVLTARANWAEHAAEDVFANAVGPGGLAGIYGSVDVPDEIWEPLETAIYKLGTWVAEQDQKEKR